VIKLIRAGFPDNKKRHGRLMCATNTPVLRQGDRTTQHNRKSGTTTKSLYRTYRNCTRKTLRVPG